MPVRMPGPRVGTRLFSWACAVRVGTPVCPVEARGRRVGTSPYTVEGTRPADGNPSMPLRAWVPRVGTPFLGVEETRPSTGELSVCWEGHPSRGWGGPPAQGGGSRHAPRRWGLAPRVPGGGLTPRAQEPGASRAAPCAPEVGFFCRARKKWGLIPRVPGASRAQEGGLAPCRMRWGRGLTPRAHG